MAVGLGPQDRPMNLRGPYMWRLEIDDPDGVPIDFTLVDGFKPPEQKVKYTPKGGGGLTFNRHVPMGLENGEFTIRFYREARSGDERMYQWLFQVVNPTTHTIGRVTQVKTTIRAFELDPTDGMTERVRHEFRGCMPISFILPDADFKDKESASIAEATFTFDFALPPEVL